MSESANANSANQSNSDNRPLCVTEKQIPNCRQPPPVADPFDSSVNLEAAYVLKKILTQLSDNNAKNNSYIASKTTYKSNYSVSETLCYLNSKTKTMPKLILKLEIRKNKDFGVGK